MPDTFEADPNKGFVAFPMSIFELDLCPGAFRTLAELCRMANAEGQCWPSLAQLGKRLGRSRAAVSGYINELRTAGVLATETQKMANGYNYRLRYTVTFWKSWRKALAQKTERSFKPVERPLRTKNHIHKKQPVPAFAGFDLLIASWKKSVGRTQYPDFERWPDEKLICATQTVVSTDQRTEVRTISADIAPMFDGFLRDRGIAAESSQRLACLKALRAADLSESRAKALILYLSAIWKPHWLNPPTPAQLTKAIAQLPTENTPDAQIKLLRSYLRRWDIQQQRLHFTPSAANVAA